MRDKKVEYACDRLEKLIESAKQIIEDSRNQVAYPGSCTHRMAAYARFYWLRKEISRTTRNLGTGIPDYLGYTEVEYDK